MSYEQTNLISDIGGTAKYTHSKVVNPWGAFVTRDTIWVALADSKIVAEYTKEGVLIREVLTTGSPVGLVNTSALPAFNAEWVTVTEEGSIEVFRPVANSTSTVEVVPANDANKYLGAAIVNNVLYVANFKTGTVDLFNSSYVFTDVVEDPALKAAAYNPFNVYAVKETLFITYALLEVNAEGKVEEVTGTGNGYLNTLNLRNGLLTRLVSRGPLNAPWGMLHFDSKLYVGNFGNGLINIFDLKGDRVSYLGDVKNEKGALLINDGLWSIVSDSYSKDKIYFTAGSQDEKHGLIGVLSDTCWYRSSDSCDCNSGSNSDSDCYTSGNSSWNYC
jgi:uncharacterized protein (TIGR03118 family)